MHNSNSITCPRIVIVINNNNNNNSNNNNRVHDLLSPLYKSSPSLPLWRLNCCSFRLWIEAVSFFIHLLVADANVLVGGGGGGDGGSGNSDGGSNNSIFHLLTTISRCLD